MNRARTTPFSFIPDATYELIVYVFSGAIFLGCFVIFFIDLNYAASLYGELETSEKVSGIGLTSIALYIYGQIASVFATYFVKRPSRTLVKYFFKRKYSDFNFDYPDLLEGFPILDRYKRKRTGNYWTLLYYLTLNYPEIADDLWERYARLKLARLNCFNAMLLLILLIFALATKTFSSTHSEIFRLDHPPYKFAISALLFSVCLAEYIQRQCWFGDVMVKACAAVRVNN